MPGPQIDVIDMTWCGAPPAAVAAAVAEPANWRRWWPQLRLELAEHRGADGVRWRVAPSPAGRGLLLAGSAEVWLHREFGGLVGYVFLRLDPVDGRVLPPRRVARLTARYRRQCKRAFWSLDDRLDLARPGRLTDPARRSAVAPGDADPLTGRRAANARPGGVTPAG